MGRLIEDKNLRDKVHIFKNRADAGKILAQMLSDYRSSDAIILAIPAGGVPVAYEIAKGIGLALDLIIVRKIQIPGNPEAGFGAVGPDGTVVFNEGLMRQLRLTQAEIEQQVEKTKKVLKARNQAYRGGRPFPNIEQRAVIVVDDGLASGYTMYEAIEFLKKKGPKKIIIAVPTSPERTIQMLLPCVDEIYCLNIRKSFSFAVADAYRDWYDVSDEEVISLLERAKKF